MTWRRWRRVRWRRRRAALFTALLVSISGGAGTAVAAGGRAGATYVGTTSLGGTVTLKVSSTGRRVVSSSFRFRPRNCSHGDYLSGTLDTGPRDKIRIGGAGRFRRRFKRVPIANNGKSLGTTTITIGGRFGDGGQSLRGRVSYSHVRFHNGGTCRDFSLTYTAQRSS
jgi:hypothetical protein